MSERLRVLVVDDERPARSFLVALLRRFDDVEVVGEAATGDEAVATIEQVRPDVALLDLHMPGLDGLGVVRSLRREVLPLVVFVTAHDEYAVQAFELHAVDYLLKPVSQARLREAINRAIERLEWREQREDLLDRTRAVAEAAAQPESRYLERIPVRRRDSTVLVPVRQIAAITAEGELLHITTTRNERHTITFRLKALEARLDPRLFIRLSRGTLANVELIQRVTAMPGGTHLVTLSTGLQLPVSRIQSRVLRQRLLTI